MRIFIAPALALLIAQTASAVPANVVVCVGGVVDGPMLARATQEASEVFATIGVRMQWRSMGRQCPDRAIQVTITDHTPPDFRKGALAFALPYEGTHIQLFYDRISDGRPGMTHCVLTYVLVHEIAHMLQGIARHSAEGVMKAGWNEHDYKLMLHRRLEFTQADIDLIHDGLQLRDTSVVLATR